MTSTDGSLWHSVDGVDLRGGTVRVVGSWEGSFLAAGVGGTADEPRLEIWQSPDARTWMNLADLSLPGSVHLADQLKMSAAYATDDKITVVGEIWPQTCHEGCDGPISVRQWTSTDNGGSWHSSTLSAEAENRQPAIKIGGVEVRVSQYWDSFESTMDGKSWQPITEPTGGQYGPRNVRLTPFGAVAVGYTGDYDGGLVLVSTDGVTWTQSVGSHDLDLMSVVGDVAGYGSTLVITGFNNRSALGYVLVSTPSN